MPRRDADVVLPRLPLQFHRLGRPQRSRRVPFADAQEDAVALVVAPPRPSPPPPPSTPNRTRPPSKPAGGRAMRSAPSVRQRIPPAPEIASTAAGSRSRGGRGATRRARRLRHQHRTLDADTRPPGRPGSPWRAGRRPHRRHPPRRQDRRIGSTVVVARNRTTVDRHPGTTVGPPRPCRPHPEQGALEVRRQGARHRERKRPVALADHGCPRSSREARRRPMRPINLPAYGKVEACPRSRRTSPSAA